MDYSLRPARPSDLEFVVSLHHETLREYIEPIWGWDQKTWDGFVKDWFKPEKVKIVQINSKDVGLLVVEERESEIYFESVSLTPSLQGQGIGSKIVSDVVKQAAAKNLPINLDVLKTNDGARRLYERVGFRVCGETDAHYFRMTNSF